MKFKLPDTIYSPQDLTGLLLELHDYSRWFAHDAMKKRVTSKQYAADAPALSKEAEQLLHQSPVTQAHIDGIIHVLERYRQHANTMTIVLAAPPTSDIKQTLVSWCRLNIAADILVSFQFNSTLLGGMVIRHGSRVYDWSFRRQILAARSSFPEVLRRV